MSYTIDRIVLEQLKETRANLAKDLDEIANGKSRNIFYYGDDEADAAEIAKHLQAFDLLIDWYLIPE